MGMRRGCMSSSRCENGRERERERAVPPPSIFNPPRPPSLTFLSLIPPVLSLIFSQKPACDAYFYLPARREHRGLGGIFYDDIGAVAAGLGKAKAVDGAVFSRDVTSGWLPSWLPAVDARRHAPVAPAQRAWQLGRRGRYLEFNLLYDRGVRFGLDSANNNNSDPAAPPPRVDAVMVSAPPLIAWSYVPEGTDGQPVPGSPEAAVVAVLQAPRAWV